MPYISSNKDLGDLPILGSIRTWVTYNSGQYKDLGDLPILGSIRTWETYNSGQYKDLGDLQFWAAMTWVTHQFLAARTYQFWAE